MFQEQVQKNLNIYTEHMYLHIMEANHMTTMTLAVPNELKEKMDHFPEINWSEVARQAFHQKIVDLEFIANFKARSTLTDADAQRIGKIVSKKASERLRRKVA